MPGNVPYALRRKHGRGRGDRRPGWAQGDHRMGRWATVGPTRGTRTANSSSLNRPLPSCQRLFDSRDLHPQGRYAPSLTGYLTRIAFGIDNRRCSRQKLAQLGVAEVAGTDSGPACGNFTVAGVRSGVVPGLFLPRLVENHGLRRDHSSYQLVQNRCYAPPQFTWIRLTTSAL